MGEGDGAEHCVHKNLYIGNCSSFLLPLVGDRCLCTLQTEGGGILPGMREASLEAGCS